MVLRINSRFLNRAIFPNKNYIDYLNNCPYVADERARWQLIVNTTENSFNI